MRNQNCAEFNSVFGYDFSYKEKKHTAICPMTKPPLQTEISKTKGQHKTPPKTSITQRLRTDLGRLVGVTTVIPLVTHCYSIS